MNLKELSDFLQSQKRFSLYERYEGKEELLDSFLLSEVKYLPSKEKYLQILKVDVDNCKIIAKPEYEERIIDDNPYIPLEVEKINIRQEEKELL